MSDILKDNGLAEIEVHAHDENVGLTADEIEAVFKSHHALAAERDRLRDLSSDQTAIEMEVRRQLSELEAQCASLTEQRDTSVDKERELALKVVTLTEERDRMDKVWRTAVQERDAAGDMLEAAYNKTDERAVESFRARAVESIRAKRAEWQRMFDKDVIGDFDERVYYARAADELASLVESLPLEPEQKEKL